MATVSADQLFTASNIISVGVATLGVNVVTNAVRKLSNGSVSTNWTAFGAAMIIAYLVVAIQTSPQWYDWVLAFFNACLLFCSALGVQEVGAAKTGQGGAGVIGAQPLFKSWLK